ncbi:ATP-binding cassette sub-family A member 7 [Lucilia sericata]|uniref:ATP-binding cassette sub-family A member 7 n=1 Tax=Lucilia sericata TaxID=13632 RepID=UPI0018A7FDDF|nr:ATP-binding cassette sub-family A member 7 [Lucilia sericata]
MVRRGFCLLLKKNLIVELRSYKNTLIEILLIMAIFIAVILLQRTDNKTLKKSFFRRDVIPYDLIEFKKLMGISSAKIPYNLYYTPVNNYNQNIFKLTAQQLNLSAAIGFDTENEMLEQFTAANTLAAVVLQGHNITIRFPNYFRTRPSKNYYKPHDFWLTRCSGLLDSANKKHLDYYDREGFLQLLYTTVATQLNVENLDVTKDYEMPKLIYMHYNSEPKIPCVNDMHRRTITRESFLIWSLYYFLYLMPFLNLLWKFSREHEENIFAHHWLYGLSYNTQRFAHCVVSLLHFILLDLVIFGFIISISSPLPTGKPLLLFGFLIVYNMLLIVYAMIFSSLIANGKTALWLGFTLWIISYAVFSEILNTIHFTIIKPKIIFISLVFFNNILPNGLIDYFQGEEIETLDLFILQFVILIIYNLILKCGDYYWPGRYIRRRISRVKNKQLCKKNYQEIKPNLYENNMEYGPLNTEILELKNVSSSCDYFNNRSQLKNISMRFFKNEISVILGPHGSGKTSLLSILAGWQTYEGQIFYLGQDITIKTCNYRSCTDVSMPNNSVFDILTIRETLKYFILLKKTKEDTRQLELELNKWLNIVKYTIKDCCKLVKTLSFGEKRLLSLCCTLVCNTSVILLDEPTLHMKSEDQFRYWDILRQEKENRCIIISTFSVDEAAEIGDRIGILNEGSLIAWGSPYFLRTTFGVGFYLICFIQPMKPIKPITQLLNKYIANIKIHQHFIDRVIYLMPADRKPIFQRLLIELEKDFNKLGITNIYISGSSLNDVYMSLTLKPDIKQPLPNVKNSLKFLHEKKTKFHKLLAQAVFFKKLCLQAKNSLPIFIIFMACFLIMIFDQMSLANLKVHSIIFSSQGVKRDNVNFYVEILNLDDISNGVFSYRNLKYSNKLDEQRLESNSNSLAALKDSKPRLSVWMNEEIFHSTPLALNLAFNYLVNNFTFINKPIDLQTDHDLHIILGTIMPLTASVVFVILQEERFSNMLTLQRIAGLNDRMKWLMTFLWDYLVYLLISVLYIIIIMTFVIDNSRWQVVAAAFLLFILSGMASILFVYLMSLFIIEDCKFRGFIKIFLIQVFLGLFPYILYNNILQEYFETLFYIFMISPGFSVLHGTTKIFNNNEKLNFSAYFQWHNPGILDSICFISFITLIYLTIFITVIVYRKKYLQSTPKRVKQMASVCYPYDDERVVKEKVRISNMNIKACRAQAILVDQLENILPKKGQRVTAISFALNKYSCLGIYGSSHSGKSHLIKQLVGEKGYWFGEVYIAGFNCKKQFSKALQHIGYCPQNKGFNSLLTPRELLTYFLMLNGVKETKRLDHIRDLSITLQLRYYMNTRIEYLPVNIQRRLNLAVALINHKNILILDEPTKGLPAYDRYLIWNILRYYRSLGNTIIFTTSESLELKELSDMMIAVNEGEMLLFDNAHNMEFQYNAGFYLEIKLLAEGLTLEEVEENLNNDVENLNRFVTFFHEQSELLSRSGSVLKYYIPVENVIYSYIFGIIEKNRQRLNIADYTLTPFSLHNVLRLLQKSRKEKKRHERSRKSVLKDAKILPRRD